MATYTDLFTGVNGTALDTYDATWVFIDGEGHDYFGLTNSGTAAGALFAGGNAVKIFRYNVSITQDQFVEFIVENIGSTFDGVNLFCLLLRTDTGTTNSNHYRLHVQDDNSDGGLHTFEIYKTTTGTPSIMGASFTAALTNGDVVRFQATGGATTTLVVKINGTTVGTRTDSTSPFTSGQFGIGGTKPSGIRASAATGGDLSAPSVSAATLGQFIGVMQ